MTHLPTHALRVALASALLLMMSTWASLGCGVETYRERLPVDDLSIRLVSDREGAIMIERLGEGEALSVLPTAIVSAEHIRHVRLLDSAEGSRILVLDLDDRGRDRLHEASRAHVGERLAIIASGRIIAAPTIRGPLTESEANIAVPLEMLETAFAAMGAPEQ